jgi:phosphoribosyl 1,2-cyclic phosphodiesterase
MRYCRRHDTRSSGCWVSFLQAQALADAFRQQAEELAFMSQNLPQHLPAQQLASMSAAAQPDKVHMLHMSHTSILRLQ